MKNLIHVNKREIGFSLLNGFLGGTGTASGFVFSLLAALIALLGLSGSLLIGISIGALVLFSALALLVGAYFFKKSSSGGENLHQKLINENERLKDALIRRVLLSSPERLHQESLLENPSPLKPSYFPLAKKIKELEKTEYNLDQNTALIKLAWNDPTDPDDPDSNLQKLYLDYQRELSIHSQTSFPLADSPTLLACVNSFIDYGCSLGPSLGLIGILSGLGVLGGLAALATPVLLSLLIAVTLVTIIGAYGVYYCESRNMKRNQLFTAMEEQIKHFTNTQENTKRIMENSVVTSTKENPTVFPSLLTKSPSPSTPTTPKVTHKKKTDNEEIELIDYSVE